MGKQVLPNLLDFFFFELSLHYSLYFIPFIFITNSFHTQHLDPDFYSTKKQTIQLCSIQVCGPLILVVTRIINVWNGFV